MFLFQATATSSSTDPSSGAGAALRRPAAPKLDGAPGVGGEGGRWTNEVGERMVNEHIEGYVTHGM